jgi:uncharacterized protein YmfQ (DUF2313 family)
MNHSDVLKLLFPVELSGIHDTDMAIDGGALDDTQTSAETLLMEMFPDMTSELIASWERVYGVIPAADATLQSRRNAVVAKIRNRRGLSRQYFINLALCMGWTITIDELLPFMSGYGRSADYLYVPECRWIWRVNVAGSAVSWFRTAMSAAGERLTWWISNATLEELFNDLKPAHTYVLFNYS